MKCIRGKCENEALSFSNYCINHSPFQLKSDQKIRSRFKKAVVIALFGYIFGFIMGVSYHAIW